MSEDSDKRERDEELEALLRQLVPAPLDVHLVAKLNREREGTLLSHDYSPARMQWRRVIPLTLVSTLPVRSSARTDEDRLRSGLPDGNLPWEKACLSFFGLDAQGKDRL